MQTTDKLSAQERKGIAGNRSRLTLGLGLSMLLVAVLTAMLHPTKMLSDSIGSVDLESLVPVEFNDWEILPQASVTIVDPQQSETLERIYQQTLSRTYRARDGYRVMLSIAYGDDQRDSVGLHYPDICYPAQGFSLLNKMFVELDTDYGTIRAKQLLTAKGRRHEPVTYWTTVGTQIARGRSEKKIMEIQYGLKGLVPDGLLFRVSSIDEDSTQAFARQKEFVNQLVGSLSWDSRQRLAGLSP